jgi:hypothetical protein
MSGQKVIFKPKVLGGYSQHGSAVQRRKQPRRRRPLLTVKQILEWADAYHQRTGRWPKQTSRPVYGAIGETWTAIYLALRNGNRGLPGGSSLAQLLAEHRGVRKPGHRQHGLGRNRGRPARFPDAYCSASSPILALSRGFLDNGGIVAR